jgi:hypothetical protein
MFHHIQERRPLLERRQCSWPWRLLPSSSVVPSPRRGQTLQTFRGTHTTGTCSIFVERHDERGSTGENVVTEKKRLYHFDVLPLVQVPSQLTALTAYADAMLAHSAFTATVYPEETVIWGWTNARASTPAESE